MNPKSAGRLKFLAKKFHLLYLVLASVICFAFVYLVEAEWLKGKNKVTHETVKQHITNSHDTHINSHNQELTFPGLKNNSGAARKNYSLKDKESETLQDLKNEINAILEKEKTNERLKSASVFLLDLDDEEWIDIDPGETFHPASLLKLTVLICYLKKSEADPGLMQRSFVLDKNAYAPHQTFEEQNIQPGVAYMVSDLLFRMITRSDNFATSLLNSHLEATSLAAMFKAHKLDHLNYTDPGFTITGKDFSKFMISLYYASYLNVENSEKALRILTQTDFRKGLLSSIPSELTIAHKFGENSLTATKELHETGIIYSNGKTYLLTIMTKGRNVNEQAEVIGEVSGLVYKHFNP